LIANQANGVTVYEFPNLKALPRVRHAVFTRSNGHSRKPYASLNASFGVGDDPRHVQGNRRVIQESLAADELVFARQVHGTRILDCAKPGGLPTNPPPAAPEGDALVTDKPRRFVAIQVADCQPILLADARQRVVAGVHAGWRGSIRNIIGRTVRHLQRRFSVDPSDLVAGIGPSLGPCCAEFVNYRREIPEAFWDYKNESDHFDFWAVSRDQLAAAGVPAENIHVSGICTRCRTDLFFSYRGEGRTGRFAAAIGLT
jgi:YfiH family protein